MMAKKYISLLFLSTLFFFKELKAVEPNFKIPVSSTYVYPNMQIDLISQLNTGFSAIKIAVKGVYGYVKLLARIEKSIRIMKSNYDFLMYIGEQIGKVPQKKRKLLEVLREIDDFSEAAAYIKMIYYFIDNLERKVNLVANKFDLIFDEIDNIIKKLSGVPAELQSGNANALEEVMLGLEDIVSLFSSLENLSKNIIEIIIDFDELIFLGKKVNHYQSLKNDNYRTKIYTYTYNGQKIAF